MVMVSKRNLDMWKSALPLFFVAVHLFMFIFIIYSIFTSGPIFLVVIYGLIAFSHFFIFKLQRLFKLKEVYLDESNKQLIIKDLGTLKQSFVEFSDIIEVRMKFGITELETISNEKIYTIPNSEWEFNYLKAVINL